MTQAELLNNINRFECGDPEPLNRDELIKFFQYLIDSGDAWQLQGFYGRTADSLIQQGLLKNNHTNKFTEKIFKRYEKN